MGTDLEAYIPVHDPSSEVVLHHYTRPSSASKIFSTRQLKISRLQNVNDRREWRMVQLIPEYPYGWKGMSEYLIDFYDRETRLGFTCFSDSCTLPQMWKRYGISDENRPNGGICIQFVAQRNMEIEGHFGQLVKKVKYRSRVSQLRVPGSLCARLESEPACMDLAKSFEPYLFEMLTTKHRKWKGEQEYRVFVSDKDRSNMVELGPGLRVTGMILGKCCVLPPEGVADLAKLWNPNSPVPVFRIQENTIHPVQL